MFNLAQAIKFHRSRTILFAVFIIFFFSVNGERRVPRLLNQKLIAREELAVALGSLGLAWPGSYAARL